MGSEFESGIDQIMRTVYGMVRIRGYGEADTQKMGTVRRLRSRQQSYCPMKDPAQPSPYG